MLPKSLTEIEKEEVLRAIDRFYSEEGLATCYSFERSTSRGRRVKGKWCQFFNQNPDTHWPGLDYSWSQDGRSFNQRLMMYAMFLELNGEIP